jgi:hypothetical protein
LVSSLLPDHDGRLQRFVRGYRSCHPLAGLITSLPLFLSCSIAYSCLCFLPQYQHEGKWVNFANPIQLQIEEQFLLDNPRFTLTDNSMRSKTTTSSMPSSATKTTTTTTTTNEPNLRFDLVRVSFFLLALLFCRQSCSFSPIQTFMVMMNEDTSTSCVVRRITPKVPFLFPSLSPFSS